MGSLRRSLGEVRKMRQRLSGGSIKIPLEDGTSFQCPADAVGEELFMFFMNTLRALHAGEPRPEPPELILAIASANDRAKAFRVAFSHGPPSLPIDVEALVERGELVARPLVTSEVSV